MNAAPMFDLDFSLQLGDFRREIRIADDARVIALAGHSGAGKTSVLNAIAGLITPERGRIAVAGHCLFDSEHGIDVPAHHRRIGYVFQDARLFPHLDVRHNLLYGLRGERKSQPRFDFDAIVGLLGIDPLLSRRTAGLSGGEAQRVAIGRALLAQPAVLLLDEPLSALDQPRREELIPYLQRIGDELRLPMIYVSHHAQEVERLADAVHELT